MGIKTGNGFPEPQVLRMNNVLHIDGEEVETKNFMMSLKDENEVRHPIQIFLD